LGLVLFVAGVGVDPVRGVGEEEGREEVGVDLEGLGLEVAGDETDEGGATTTVAVAVGKLEQRGEPTCKGFGTLPTRLRSR